MAKQVIMSTVDGELPELHFDIVSSILLRLPVKSLCRFKCVSKPWLFHISNPKFAKEHLNLNKKKQNQLTKRLFGISYFDEYYSLDLESSGSTPKKVRLRSDQSPMSLTKVLGCCDGLLLLHGENKSIYLANPSTGECKTLPQCPLSVDSLSDRYGLGYDLTVDDYKVVKISRMNRLDMTVMSVYSLRDNSWRRIHSALQSQSCESYNGGVFFSGAIHWLGTANIIALDLASDSFRTMPYPDSVPSNKRGEKVIGLDVIGGHLCVVEMKTDMYRHCNVYVMNEYGVRDSWVRIFVDCYKSPIIWVPRSRVYKLFLQPGQTAKESIVRGFHGSNSSVIYEETLIKLQEHDEDASTN